MNGPKFSPIDVPWLSADPDAACCQCPDHLRELADAVDYCPQHGDKPDFSICHHSEEGGRQWRTDHGLPLSGATGSQP